jgi:hypothetical protein
MIEIKAEHEDKIFPIRDFISELQKIQDERFEKLLAELIADGFDSDLTDRLFDYIFNSDPAVEQVTFEEFCDGKFMRKYHQENQ